MRTKNLALILVMIFISSVHTVLYLSPWGQLLEMKFLDLWFFLRGPVEPPQEVAVIAMDEDSYGILGLSPNQPWPRDSHAKLLKRLAELGARRVAFDVLFLGPGPSPEADQELAQATGLLPTVIGADFGIIQEKYYQKQGLLLPAESLRERCEAVALVGLPEENGFIRRFLIERSELTSDLPSLAEAAVAKKGDEIRSPSPRDLINYYGPPRTIPTYSYYQVLETEHPLPPKTLRDKIVFVGLSLRTELGPAQKDAYLTPFSKTGRMFGVEIHATAAANLMTGNWIRRLRLWTESVALGFLTLILACAIFRIRPQWGALTILGFALVWGVAAYGSFLLRRFVPGAVLTMVTLPFAYLGSTLYYYVVTRRKQRQLERAFQFYLSPEMARQVAQNPEALRLGGEKVIATAMFTDIENFTEKAESMPPEEVANMLNAYFTEVMNAIFEKKGTLIKFIGDAVFALWGAPIKTANHAELACESALAIQREIEKFNASDRFPTLKTRIGIHTGPMVVGNLGSSRRFDFTAIGDTVNLASRIEGVNKYFGTNILVTNTVQVQLNSNFNCIKLGFIRVAGKKEVVDLYTLLTRALPSDITSLWSQALNEFSQKNWSASRTYFNQIKNKAVQLEKAREFYLKQIEIFELMVPTSDWKGEITFTSK